MDDTQPSKRAVYACIGFFLLVALGMIVGAYFERRDETTGTPGKATITRCHSHVATSGGVHCVGTWSVNGRRVVDGPIGNAKQNQVGETVSVRIHGGRATIPALWISIALAALGVVLAVFALWLFARFRKRFQTA